MRQHIRIIALVLMALICGCDYGERPSFRFTGGLLAVSPPQAPASSSISSALVAQLGYDGQLIISDSDPLEHGSGRRMPTGVLFDLDRSGKIVSLEPAQSVDAHRYQSVIVEGWYESRQDRAQFDKLHSVFTLVPAGDSTTSTITLKLHWKTMFRSSQTVTSTASNALVVTSGQYFRSTFIMEDNPLWVESLSEFSLSVEGLKAQGNLHITGFMIKPTEPSFEGHLRETRWKIGDQSRPCRVIDSTAGLSIRGFLEKPATLHFGCGVLNSTPGSAPFELTVTVMGNAAHALKTQTVALSSSSHDAESWTDYSFDLESFTGQTVDLTWTVTHAMPEDRSPGSSRPLMLLSQPWLAAITPGVQDRGSVLIISLDTLRQDRLGCYGYPHQTSPWLDWLSKRADLWNQGITPSPSTGPAHTSLLSGLLPSEHGVVFRPDILRAHIRMLASHFLSQGYATFAVTGGGNIDAYRKIDRGFLAYDDGDRAITSCRERLMPLIERFSRLPLFLFYHTYEIHSPFPRRPPITSYFDPDYQGSVTGREMFGGNQEHHFTRADITHLNALYDSGIRETDRVMGQLFLLMMDRNMWDRATVLVISDHGEQFSEHDLYGHGNSLYEELVAVPFFMKNRGQTMASLIDTPISLVDVPKLLSERVSLPTFDAPHQDDIRRDFTPEETSTFSELKYELYSLRQGDYKIIRPLDDSSTQSLSLFSLPSRELPAENSADRYPEKAFSLDRTISSYISLNPPPDTNKTSSTASPLLDQKTAETLKALGYVE